MGLLSALCKSRRPGRQSIEREWKHLEETKNSLHETQRGEYPNIKSIPAAVFDAELRYYASNIVFKPGESVDMDLSNKNRSLIHTGKLLRRPETRFDWNGWTELFVLLFDNYLVLTTMKEIDGVTKYFVNGRPIPLDLLSLTGFLDSPTRRSAGILRRGLGNRPGGVSDGATDSPLVYPYTILYGGRLGGRYTLFTESSQARTEWKQKLEEAISLRRVVQRSNKVFEMEPLSTDTFSAPVMPVGKTAPSWSHETSFPGKVTCSVPFAATDGKALVAIGCAEGVWVGFRRNSRSMRHVLHHKLVTQCAVLEDFGIFLVLADKVLFAYHIEALIPSSPQNAHTSRDPQRVSGTQDVHFFSVGKQGGRTLVIYMKKQRLDSIFCVLEPVVEKINERSGVPVAFTSWSGIRPVRSEWFRVYREFFLPSKSFDLVFLRARIAILCPKGFEIMDITDFMSITIPLRDDGHKLLVKRCEACKPKGMFRVENEFLLCYGEFGVYVNKHGSPSRSSSTIEWEGTAERVAMHWPYILLFDSRFIEVRHITTGLLAQIIPGNDIQCIWDGRGTPTTAEVLQQPMNHDPQIHVVMSLPESQAQTGQPGRPQAIAQHVFEIVSTVPQPLGSLASQPVHFHRSKLPPPSRNTKAVTLRN